jgi:hypothetical protein
MYREQAGKHAVDVAVDLASAKAESARTIGVRTPYAIDAIAPAV